MALATSKSPHYRSFVMRDENGTRTFDSNMSMEKREQLFNLTFQALDPAKCNLEFITSQMIDEGDGLKLWESIERRFKMAEKSEFDRDDLKSEFKSITKNPSESNDTYLRRVEKKLAYLASHDINPTYKEQAVVLLEGL